MSSELMARGTAQRVGVVLVAFNGLDYTRECLASVAAAAAEGAEVVTVLVDNGSTDGTVEYVRTKWPGVAVVEMGENTGFTGGNNAGIRWCLEHDCSAVMLLNNDAVLSRGALHRMLAALEERNIVVPEIRSAAAPHEVQDELGWFDWRRGVAQPLRSLPPASRAGRPPVRIASGCCLLVPRAAFETVGLLDERFFLYFEDVDFIVRAQLAGFRITEERAAVVYHHGRGSSGGGVSPATLYYNTRNRLLLMQKYSQVNTPFLLYFAASRLAYAVSYVVRGDFARLRSVVRAIRDVALRRVARADYRW